MSGEGDQDQIVFLTILQHSLQSLANGLGQWQGARGLGSLGLRHHNHAAKARLLQDLGQLEHVVFGIGQILELVPVVLAHAHDNRVPTTPGFLTAYGMSHRDGETDSHQNQHTKRRTPLSESHHTASLGIAGQ